MSKASEFLGKRLRALRQASKLTQEQAAALVGVTFKYYQRMEAGGIEGLRLSTLEQVSNGYGLSLAELFNNAIPTPKPSRQTALPPHRRSPKPT